MQENSYFEKLKHLCINHIQVILITGHSPHRLLQCVTISSEITLDLIHIKVHLYITEVPIKKLISKKWKERENTPQTFSSKKR